MSQYFDYVSEKLFGCSENDLELNHLFIVSERKQ